MGKRAKARIERQWLRLRGEMHDLELLAGEAGTCPEVWGIYRDKKDQLAELGRMMDAARVGVA
jgi:hypothetical protein